MSAVIPEHAGIQTIASHCLDARVRGYEKLARPAIHARGIWSGAVLSIKNAKPRAHEIDSLRLSESQNG